MVTLHRTGVHSGSRPLFRTVNAFQTAMRDYDQALQRMVYPYEVRYVPTRHGSTHVILTGTVGKPWVVLWHGMNVNSTMWCGLMDLLGADYQIAAIDTIGNQGRSAATRPNKHGAAHSEWALDVLDGLDIPVAHCVGFSQGGWLIFRLAEVASQRIRSAVLLSSAGLVGVNLQLLLRMAPALLLPAGEARARALIRMTSAPRHQPSPYEVRVFMNMQNYYIEGRVPVLHDSQIRALRAPVRLIMGGYDHTFNPPRAIRRFQRLLPHGETILLDSLSHGLEEDRAHVYHLIEDFLRGL